MSAYQLDNAIKLLMAGFLISILIGCDQGETLIPGTGKVQVGDIELFYKIIGEGEPILVLHGGPGLDHTYLLPQLSELTDDQQLIFYDQRATGQSTGNADSLSITVARFVDDLEILRGHLKLDRLTILGHSWGGLLAMYYAAQYPEQVNSLILVSSLGATDESFAAMAVSLGDRMSQETIQAQQELVTTNAFQEREPDAIQHYVRLQFEAYFHDRTLIDKLNLAFSQQTASNVLTVYGLLLPQIMDYDLSQSLVNISVPVLLIHGDDDPIPLSYAQGLAALFHDADL